ncbi:hypothetical protein PIROE2DRAFT_9829 [Piromyces sp. E2]|nr:hypothetical protein PIROE2DRAFT_9829 [Piromyces sp. E2]|eukprot:OUM63611.1 hypothetical protein PIROE2DRAFT_9829 [Piromyces sp. E2]
MSIAGPLEDIYTRQYFNSPKGSIDNSFLSLETLTNSPKFSINEKNIRNGERKRETRISDFNLFEDENKLSDKSSTLYRNSNEFDTFLPCIESVVTDSDFSDLAQEFAEFGKSFSRDSISFEEEERDYSLFPKTKPKKEFSERFKVEIDPKTKYTYNNLYNINTEIYSSFSPKSSPYKKEVEEKETKKYVNETDRLDLRFIQNALLFDSKKDEKEIYNPNENLLKALHDSPTDKKSVKSFIDIDNDVNSFNNSKRLSSITKIDKEIVINEDDISLNSKSKNRISYQSSYQYPYQSTRPTYLTSHQPANPPQFNIYNKNYPKRISTSPKPSPLSESNTDHYNRIDAKLNNNKANSYDYKGYFALDKPNNKSNEIQTREIPSSNDYNIDDSTSSDDIPLASITGKIKPSSTPNLSALSISVPGDKSQNSSANKSKKITGKPLIDLSSENTPTIDYLKPEFSSAVANEKKDRKVSIKVPKKKKKKQLFSYCCSSKALDNSFVEDGSRNFNRDLYIKCQKEQIHSFEAKRMNSAKNRNNSSNVTSNLILSSIQTDSVTNKKEKNRVSFQPNYLSRRSSDGSNLSGVSSVSSSSSHSNSESESEVSSSNNFKSIIIDNSSMKEIKNFLNSDINDKSPPKTIVVPSNQTNTQYIQSKREKIYDDLSSPISNRDIPSSPNSNNSTVSSSNTSSPVPGRKMQEIKYCTSYELCDDGNWRLVERRYNDSKVLKVEIISSKMI